ncbi:MAG: molybdenum cofactor biosynthesis protein MoaE [Deltaproteobacteria bacterium]|nr:molybdenum cofactor biosynthesis protein MoaE [Deltaproteobacteria bacterium]
MIEITEKPIEVWKLFQSVATKSAGAIVPFIGTVRSEDGIEGLFYEAHRLMAVREMEKIVQSAKEKWPIEKIAVVHRIGWVPVGEASLVIAVSSPHRREAFEACQFIIDEIKKGVPIWKSKEKKYAQNF